MEGDLYLSTFFRKSNARGKKGHRLTDEDMLGLIRQGKCEQMSIFKRSIFGEQAISDVTIVVIIKRIADARPVHESSRAQFRESPPATDCLSTPPIGHPSLPDTPF